MRTSPSLSPPEVESVVSTLRGEFGSNGKSVTVQVRLRVVCPFVVFVHGRLGRLTLLLPEPADVVPAADEFPAADEVILTCASSLEGGEWSQSTDL